MVTKLRATLTRETTLMDHVSCQPWIISLEDGGKTVVLHPKRHKIAYRIPLREIIVQAGRIKAQERQAMKRQRRPAHV